MSKIAVVYWSGGGNTEAMANAVADGAKTKGAEVSVFEADKFSASMMDDYDAIAFGCPSMGDEQLEEEIFEPMFNDCKPKLKGKNITLFGSYGWGDGEWMDSWEKDCQNEGANLISDCIICNEAPDDDCIEELKSAGAALVK